MSVDLSGKSALVTGATRGLGRALALALAEAGADVAVVGRDPANAAAAAAEIEALGRRGLGLPADVMDDAAMAAAAEQAIAAFGKLDILVCTAGVGVPRRPVWEATPEDFHHCFDVNVLGTLCALRAVMPHMTERRSGRVVAIGGTYGHKGVAGFGVYAASKWALRGLIRSAALDAGPYGVTVNIVAPGGVDGDRIRAQFARSAAERGETPEAVLQRFVSGSALGRLVETSDIAAAMLHLLSEGGANITGQDIIVDAGVIV
jgi:NAD(P)-dependent dehydrogenase (short-subunit alcohol dehydrogenase family)